mgnify:CR=1 FL=1
MLAHLSIRDIVLIERLEIDFSAGLSVLTGETGAGKSILLDALSLALGARGDAALVRQGATQGQVFMRFAGTRMNATSFDNTPFKRKCDVFCHQLCIDLRMLNFHYVDQRCFTGHFFNVFSQVFDTLTAFSNNHAWFRSVNV